MKKQGFLLVFALVAAFILVVVPLSYVHAQEGSGGPCSGNLELGQCVINIYQWALGIAVLLALIMIIVAGYRYMTAGGNAQTVAGAKEMLTGALVGLVLLFSAVLILRTINPDLVNFDNLKNIGKKAPVPSTTVPAQNPRVAQGAPVSNEVVQAAALNNVAIDQFGNITGGDSQDSTYNMSVVDNSEGCKQIVDGLEARGSTRTWGCTQYSIDNPANMPASLKSAVGGETNSIIVVVGSTFIFDGNWIYEGGGVNISTAIDLILGIYQQAADSGNPSNIPGGSTSGGEGSSVGCTLEVFCEDPSNGDRYEPGPSGCQGAGYSGPAGTRQVSECLYGGDQAPSCSDQIRFDFRNCQVELDSIRIGSSNNFDYSSLPSIRGAAGTLFAVDGINEGSVNLLCSYGSNSYEAAACGAAMSGGFCEPWFSNPGCIPR